MQHRVFHMAGEVAKYQQELQQVRGGLCSPVPSLLTPISIIRELQETGRRQYSLLENQVRVHP